MGIVVCAECEERKNEPLPLMPRGGPTPCRCCGKLPCECPAGRVELEVNREPMRCVKCGSEGVLVERPTERKVWLTITCEACRHVEVY